MAHRSPAHPLRPCRFVTAPARRYCPGRGGRRHGGLSSVPVIRFQQEETAMVGVVAVVLSMVAAVVTISTKAVVLLVILC